MRITRTRAAKDTLEAMLNFVHDPDRLAVVFCELASMFEGKKTISKRVFLDWLNSALD